MAEQRQAYLRQLLERLNAAPGVEMAAAIDRLPEQQRTTLALAAAGGLNSTEIATALREPAGTVRYRLAMARRALAAALDNYDNPPAATGEQ